MDLREFYFQNVKQDDYHFVFFEAIKNVNTTYNIFSGYEEVNNYQFEVFYAEEAISKFKELCQPEVYFDKEKTCWFYLITYYLFYLGYEIKEFPRLFARPPKDPSDFVYKEIRNRIIANGDDDNETVRYATRRVFVENLTITITSTHIDLGNAIEEKFVEISNRSASFNCMSTDEKLAEIANLIENLLKKNGKFITPDYSTICFEYINDETIKAYRKQMHCFRHSAEEAIVERQSISEKQKAFLIDYGLTILKVVHELVCECK